MKTLRGIQNIRTKQGAAYFSLFSSSFSLILLLFTFSFSFFTLSAQQSYPDSLFSVWNNENLADTVRGKALLGLSWHYRNRAPDSTIYYGMALVDFASQKGLRIYEGRAFWYMGEAYENLSDYTNSQENYTLALDIFTIIKDTGRSYRMNHSLGWLNWTNGTYDTAKYFFRNAIDLAVALSDRQKEYLSMNGLAYSYFQQGHLSTAMQIVEKSLKISLEIDDADGITWGYNAMGVFYSRKGDEERALEYYLKSLEIRDQGGDSAALAYSLRNVGTTYSDLGDHVKALEYLEKSLIVGKHLQDDRNLALSLNAVASQYLLNGDTSKALENYHEALELVRGIGNRNMIGESLESIGSIQVHQGWLEKGIENCSVSYEIALELGAVDDQLLACDCLYEAYKKLGRTKDALKYLEYKYDLKDSVDLKSLSEGLQRMEFSKQMLTDSLLRVEEKQKLLITHQLEVSEKEKSRNLFMAGGVVLLLIAFGLYGRNRYVYKAKNRIEIEKERSESLLLNILPAEIAEELKQKGEAAARDFDQASILFSDFKGFTSASEKLAAADLVAEINVCFKAFDAIMEKYGIEKIKTIGDAYMAAGGLPVPSEDSVKNTVLAALEMQGFIEKRHKAKDAIGEHAFQMRVGIHTGPVVAGIVGVKKFQYDIWGDTVNTASRMESRGEAGKVNISQATYELLKDTSTPLRQGSGRTIGVTNQFDFESRGKIEAKGKGEMEMYFVTRNEEQGKRNEE